MFKAARVSILIVLLACSAQAGEMQNGTPTPPPPTPSQGDSLYEPEAPSADTTANSQELTYGETLSVPEDILTTAALDLLDNVLALL